MPQAPTQTPPLPIAPTPAKPSSTDDLMRQFGGKPTDDLMAQFGGKPAGQSDDLQFSPPPPTWLDAAKSQIGDFLSHATANSPIGQTAAMGNAILNPIQTAKHLGQQNQDLYDQAHQAFQRGDYATGVVSSVKYLLNGIPGLGSMLDQQSQDLQQGRYGAFLGDTAGMASTLKAPQVMAEKVYPAVETAIKARAAKASANAGAVTADLTKAIPPSKSAPWSPDDMNRAAPYFSSEHAASPITSVEGVIEASDSAITQIEEHVAKYIAAHPTDMIRTNPMASARTVLAQGERTTDLSKGLAALKDLGLDQPLTLAEADAKRLRLNAENRAVLKKNNYDVATARQVDPKFAAREAAAQALRDGIYDQLESRGIEGVKELRRDEGAIIRIRNAAEQKKFAGEKTVAGTGADTIRARLTRVGVPVATTALGESTFGLPGAVAGTVMGQALAKALAPGNLTRDALIERAFNRLKVPGASYPQVPEGPPIRGLLSAPAIELGGGPDTSFVRSIPAQPAPLNPRRLLDSPTMDIRLGPSPDKSGIRVVPADRGQIVRDPKTGRFKRVYSSEVNK